MFVASKIDWLTLTRPYDGDPDAIPTNSQDAAVVAAMIAQGSAVINEEKVHLARSSDAFYPWHFQTDGKVLICISDRLSQGVKVVRSGSSLPVGRSEQIKIWRSLQAELWRVTRCDVAIDFHDSGIPVYEYWKDRLEERAEARRGKTELKLTPKGDTINIGSRTSDKCMRIYDKGKEQHTQDDWVRFEIEIKGKTAHGLKMAYNDLVKSAAASMIGMTFKMPAKTLSLLQKIADGNEEIQNPARRARGNREIWLMEQVLPALKKTREEQPEVYDRFLAALIDFQTGGLYN